MLKPYSRAELTFDVLREIGADGRNSKTYVVKDHQLDAEIVAKQILKSKLDDPSNFFTESQALYASAHPNVVQIHYACFDDDHVYIAMPYYRQGSIKPLITGRWMTVREIVVAGSQVLSGLHNIHSKRLVHFDIKPDNVLLSDRGEALLSDFGQARHMNFSGVAAQDRHYTPMIPPEALSTDQLDHRFDIYQFGLTLYRMCNGNENFVEQLNKYGLRIADRDSFRRDVRSGTFPDRKQFPAHVPSKLRNIIRKCLEVDPRNRYQSAVEVANAMADVDGANLDWKHCIVGGQRIWEKNESGTKYEFSVNADESSTLYKSVNGGARRRVTDACRGRVTDRDVRTILGAY